jgi:nitroreductase
MDALQAIENRKSISSPNVPYKEVNAACAATNITIAATALGLGSCYVGSTTRGAFTDDMVLQKKAGIPDRYAPMCGVLIGYPAEEIKFPAPFNCLVGTSFFQ